MIIYGTRASLRKSEFITDQCPNCSNSKVQMNVFQRYAHIFWIPIFPIGKTGVSQCTHCQQVLQLKQMPASLKLSYDNFKRDVKLPLWIFSGVFVIAIITVAVIINDNQRSKRLKEQISHPKIGDIYEYRMNESAYTLFKVKRIIGDTVYFLSNKQQTNKTSGIRDLVKTDDGFDIELHGFLKSDLVEMNNKDQFVDIER